MSDDDRRDPLQLGPDWSETAPLVQVAETDAVTGDDIPDDEGYDSFGGGDPGEPLYDEPEDMAAAYEATVHQDVGTSSGDNPNVWKIADQGRVLSTLRDVLAALHGRTASDVSAMVGRITANADVVEVLDASQQRCFEGVFEVLTFECASVDAHAIIDFGFLPAANNYRSEVKAEFALLLNMAGEGTVPNPHSVFDALSEDIQSGRSRDSALDLVHAIDSRDSVEAKMAKFRKLKPPTRRRSVTNNTWAKPAGRWLSEARAAHGDKAPIVLSSGYPTLDAACSGQGDEMGLLRLGEFWVGGAATGHGKSAFTRRFVTAATEDLVNGWKYPDAKTILAFTEEEAEDVARAAMLDRGQPFHHLSDNVILAKVGESRRRVIEVVYDCVVEAATKSRDTKMPITEYLPYLYVLDYIQAIKEPGENADTEGVGRTADLLMRGIGAWDVEMMAQISGVDFREYAGMDWPDGMEHHRVAVFVLSQLRKEGTDVNYRAGKSNPSDFTVVDANGDLCWQPQENDYAIPNRSDLRGSGVLLNHATGLVFFHRSTPAASLVKEDGNIVGLSDTRARFVIQKARKAVSVPYVPMRFDTNPDGFRGQFYDDLAADNAVATGRLQVTDAYQRSGDPMLPVRPRRSPFRNIQY